MKPRHWRNHERRQTVLFQLHCCPLIPHWLIMRPNFQNIKIVVISLVDEKSPPQYLLVVVVSSPRSTPHPRYDLLFLLGTTLLLKKGALPI